MAPLRSSRSNRHLQQDSGPQGRIRGGVVDHDPMEGLPVRRWEMMEVTIKQDPKEEEKDDDGKEGNNPNWPWPDLPLPKDFHLLPAHSQELLRRARAPNKNPNIAVFNRETGEYERPNLNSSNPASMTPLTKPSNLKDATTKDLDHDATSPDDNPPDDPLSISSSRSFTLKRWVPLPPHLADKKPEPKYLADRRLGLPPLYGHHRAATSNANVNVNTFTTGTAGGYAPNISSTLPHPDSSTGDVVVGSVTVPTDRAANVSGYRVGADGTTMPMGPGIGGFQGQGQGQGYGGEAPKRRPPPPPPKRRKKGGPGRSKKKVEVVQPFVEESGRVGVGAATVVKPAAAAAATAVIPVGGAGEAAPAQAPGTTETGESRPQQAVAVDGGAVAAAPSNEAAGGVGEDTEMRDAEQGGEEEEGEEGSSEDEGSEEGEIDEGLESAAGAAGGEGGEVLRGRGLPEVSTHPPSPDLLGNLESEIQGMEGGIGGV